jgi:hypothetical protein
MNNPAEPPLSYTVVYSERVRNEFLDLHRRASARGQGTNMLEAVKQIDARLRLYPQFGQPLRVLAKPGETVWVGVVAPLVVQYVIDEIKHIVFVVAPFKALPNCGF